MAKKASLLVHEMFTIYSKNLHIHASKYEDLVACPLCLNRFERSAIDSQELTVEHIIPESIGGKLTTISCKQCNNYHGSKLDAHLVRRLRTEDKFCGKSKDPLRGRVFIGDGEFAANVVLTNLGHPDSVIEIRATSLPQYSNPKLNVLADNEVANTPIGKRKMRLNLELGYIEISSRVAALRSAYLMMFYYFGYGYIKHPSLDQVRFQIMNPDLETDVLKGIKILDTIPPDRNGVSVITSPESLRSFLVSLDFSTEVERYWGVALPGLDSSGFSLYERWADDIKNAPINVKTCPRNEKFLTDPKYSRIAEYFWKI